MFLCGLISSIYSNGGLVVVCCATTNVGLVYCAVSQEVCGWRREGLLVQPVLKVLLQE